MNKYNYYKLLVTFLIVIFISCASLVQANDLSRTRFQYLSTEHGLSQKSIHSIYQDKNDFLWLGTQEGLNRYDGREIKVYRHLNNDKNSLSNDVIRDIVEDHQGNLWIATIGGLNKLNRKSESFERINFTNNDGDEITRLNSIFVDKLGILWIGTEGNGIFTYDVSLDEKPVPWDSQIDQLKDLDVRVIFEDSRGRLWIGSDNNGLYQISSNKLKIEHFVQEKKSSGSLSHNQIRTITEDHKGKIWIGTRGGGINRFEELDKTFTHFYNIPGDTSSLSHDRVYKIIEDAKQTLWVATDAGLSIFQPEKNNFVRIQHDPSVQGGLNHNRVLSLFQDSGGLLWIGTFSGLNQWNPITASFVNYRHTNESKNSLTFNHIQGFAENSSGVVYIATFGGGLNYIEPSENIVHSLNEGGLGKTLSTERLYSLMVDKKEQLWIGTFGLGVYKLSKDLKEINNYQFDPDNAKSISNNGITDIIEDSDGNIWISTYQAGLNRLNKDSEEFIHYRKEDIEIGLKNENIFQIMEDDEGYIWLVTDGGGMFRLDKNTNKFINFTHDPTNQNSLSGNALWSIYQDSKGRFWIGTQGNGLNRWEPEHRRQGVNKFKHYTIENGLNSSTINGVVEDNNGFIWVSTNRGVSRLNPDSDEITPYNLADEIHGNELNQSAILKTKNGRLYFGGLEGISAFYPSEIEQNQHIPNVILTNISSEGRKVKLGQSLSDLNEIEFDHKDYLVSFEFAALDFAQPSKNQYQYKLEGLDSDWVKIGNLNRATFTNLPSGSYILKVKGSNNDGVWSNDSINLKVNVLPAPWATWWAFSLYAGSFILLLILVIRSQASRLANQEMFKSLVSEEVEMKTALYVKNNEFLNKQMEQLKFYANVDLDTGLPNQKYLCDLVKANFQWVNQFKDVNNNTCQKLCVTLIRLPSMVNYKAVDSDGIINKAAKAFSLKVDELEVDFKVTIRWGVNELAVIFYANNESECERFVNLLSKQLADVLATLIKYDLVQHPIKVGYCLLPFSGAKQSEVNSEHFLMLTEHLLHLVVEDIDKNIVGIIGANQKLNNTKFKQILDSKKLKELSEWLVLVP